jgi:4-hydroxybenzoate polyprenyltransferase
VRRVRALVGLARWPNAVLAVAAVVAGACWAAGRGVWPATGPVLWACGAAAGLVLAANAWNALEDRAIDAHAHPERPIPSGAAGAADAIALTITGAGAALGCSAAVAPWLAGVSAGVLALSLVYSRLKAWCGPTANLVAATLASLPFLYGAWAAGAPARALPLVAVALPVHLAREIAKDVDDAGADQPFRRTLPITAGLAWARGAVVVTTGIALIALALFVAHWARTAWGIVPAAVACAYGAARTAAGRSGGPAWYKLGMAGAVAGVLAGLPRWA